MLSRREEPRLTKKQFNQLCKTHELLYIADEIDDRGTRWSVWAFNAIKGEYKQREKDGE